MCDECDVELFLVLPRITWLSFLARPSRLAPLIKRMLPNRFVESKGFSGESLCDWNQELQDLLDQFRRTRLDLVAALRTGPEEDAEQLAWEVLMKRAIVGSGSEADEAYGR